MGIMMGWPHLLQGTLPNGARSPGMKTFVSHHPQVTIRSCSLMFLQAIYHRPAIRQAEKAHSSERKKPLTNLLQ
jgi:hypothetical protein